MAEVLAAAGLKTGHEAWFNPNGVRTSGLDVDVAWESTLFLNDFDGIVWHQVREPLRTITSLAYTADWHGPYWRIRKRGLTEFTDNPILNAVISYVDMNLKAEQHATKRWRVEDVDAELVKELMRELGYQPDTERVEQALKETSTRTNSHWTSLTLDWSDLPRHPVVGELRDMTERYGYA
jgi:hypothetical protein